MTDHVIPDRGFKTMAPLFAAVFIDIFSFGLMYPVIIALFHDPVIVGGYAPALRDAYLSLAFSLFPLGMFFGASFLGDLSDAIGRRRTLLICMAGLGSAYVLMWIAVETRELLFLLAGRLLSGLMAGTGPIAQAAMMDRSSEAERGRNMSNVVLVNCVGLVTGPAIDPAIRASSDVRRVGSGRGRHHDDVRLLRIYGHAAQVANLQAGAGRAPRRTRIITLEISIAGGHTQCIRRLVVNGELVGVVWPAGHSVAPCVATVDRRHERSGLDRDPQSFRFERVTRNPAHVMRIRPGRKRPFGRGLEYFQPAGLLPRISRVR